MSKIQSPRLTKTFEVETSRVIILPVVYFSHIIDFCSGNNSTHSTLHLGPNVRIRQKGIVIPKHFGNHCQNGRAETFANKFQGGGSATVCNTIASLQDQAECIPSPCANSMALVACVPCCHSWAGGRVQQTPRGRRLQWWTNVSSTKVPVGRASILCW